MPKVKIAAKAELAQPGCKVYPVNGHILALFHTEQGFFAVDNRCPHMGFPLDKGTVKDGILTCHWHHARFDLASGGAFDLFADDVLTYPVSVEGEEVFVDLTPTRDPRPYYQQRLKDGLEQNLRFVMAKAAIALVNPAEVDSASAPFEIGLLFGSHYRARGWGMGQTINGCMLNLMPHLYPADRPLAMYQGLTAVARDTEGMAPHFAIEPLPGASADLPTLKRWFRQFVEVRDNEGAERCLATALRAGATAQAISDMLFAAATDHRYLTIGHVADFTNKALESLDKAGWQHAPTVLPSLIPNYIDATRMEERNAWRYPLDLATILENAFEKIPAAWQAGAARQAGRAKNGHPHTLTSGLAVLLGDDPQAIVELLLGMLTDGVSRETLAQLVSYAAARRMAHFHVSNEFSDWDTVLHTFTYANAMQQAMRRSPSPELLRGVFDAAMSVYLDRFLNIPSTPLPQVEPTPRPAKGGSKPQDILADFMPLLNKQQQVNQAGTLVAQYLANGGQPQQLIATLSSALLREDPDFHTIQSMETAVNQYHLLAGQPEAGHPLIAAARYLAAHAPTPRAQNQTYQIALRLQYGEKVYEG